MTRSKLAKLTHELHTEPRRHLWGRRTQDLGNLLRAEVDQQCKRHGCNWLWTLGQPEPAGCTGTDTEPTSGSGDAR